MPEEKPFLLITSDKTTSKDVQRLVTLNGWRLKVTVGLYERNPDGSLKVEEDPQTREKIPVIKKLVSGENDVSMAYVRIEEI